MGPTLLLILIDMCDLYLGAYAATEPYLSSNSHGREKSHEMHSESESTTPTSRHTSGSTDSSSHVREQPDTNIVPESKSSIESDSELVVALLGGALQSLLESRYAFTPAVAERSRYRSQIISLAGEIAKRLGGVLVKVLKGHSKGHLPWPKNPTVTPVQKDTDTNCTSDDSGVNLEIKSQNIILQTTILADLTGSGSVKCNGGRSNVKANPSDTVLEVRRICVELLRWSAPSQTTSLSSPSPSPSSMLVPVPVSPSLSPSPSTADTLVGADIISVARLYELIDTLNQNEWLRSCCSNSAK